jgi:hypothetical protein
MRRRQGHFLLRTNLRDQDPARLWRHYIRLSEIEPAFKELKSDPAIRPIYHRLDHRIADHVHVSRDRLEQHRLLGFLELGARGAHQFLRFAGAGDRTQAAEHLLADLELEPGGPGFDRARAPRPKVPRRLSVRSWPTLPVSPAVGRDPDNARGTRSSVACRRAHSARKVGLLK